MAITPEQALDKLISGNGRFVNNQRQHPNQCQITRQQLEASQTPHTVILSCADSRVVPEFIFDQGIGDLFVIRNGHSKLF